MKVMQLRQTEGNAPHSQPWRGGLSPPPPFLQRVPSGLWEGRGGGQGGGAPRTRTQVFGQDQRSYEEKKARSTFFEFTEKVKTGEIKLHGQVWCWAWIRVLAFAFGLVRTGIRCARFFAGGQRGPLRVPPGPQHTALTLELRMPCVAGLWNVHSGEGGMPLGISTCTRRASFTET